MTPYIMAGLIMFLLLAILVDSSRGDYEYDYYDPNHLDFTNDPFYQRSAALVNGSPLRSRRIRRIRRR